MLTKNKLSEKKTASWAYLNSPNVAEIMAQSGFDIIIVDQEHSPWSPAASVEMMRAIRAGGAIAAVRIPAARPEYVKAALDNGAEILLAPDVRSAEEVNLLVQNCRYAPIGQRGVAHLSARASDWGRQATEYLETADKDIVVVAMLETLDAIENADAIASVSGLDALMVGVVDLSIDLKGRSGTPSLTDCVNKVEAIAKAKGIALVGVDRPADPAQDQYARGYWMVTLGNDAKFLRFSADATISAQK